MRKTLLFEVYVRRSEPKGTKEGKKDAEQLRKLIEQWAEQTQHNDVVELEELEARIEQVRERIKQTPAREGVSKSGYRQLQQESKRLSNTIKMVAYTLESRLANLLAQHYKNGANEKRRVIAAALQSAGQLRLEPGLLIIKLDPQGAPNRTRAIDALCEQLNAYRVPFPGSDRIIRFDTCRDSAADHQPPNK